MKKTLLVVVAVLIGFVCVTSLLSGNRPAITEGEALKIAQEQVRVNYGDRFEENSCQAILIDGVWIVSYHGDTPDGVYQLGGGNPEVKIRADGGQVISCFLKK